jgi:hypothetical protein
MLSTVGRDVLDGNRLGVSEESGVAVKVSVVVMETVCEGEAVAVGTRGVSVTAANDVFVGTLVWTRVGAMGVEVKVQANEVIMPRIEKISFRLMIEAMFLSRIIYSNI